MKKVLLSTTIILCSLLLHAQNFLGLVNNNYSGFNSVLFNPAMGNRTMVSANLVGFNSNIYNNYLRFKDLNIIKAINDTGYFNDSTGWNLKDNVIERINGNPKYVTSTFDVRGPSLMIGIGKVQAGVFWNRVRVGFQMSGVDEALARNIFYIGRTTLIDIANLRFSTNQFAINLNAWTESGLTAAVTLKDDKKALVRVGATVKSLNGLGAMYIKNNGTSFNFYRQPNSTSTDSVLTANYDMELGFTNEFSYDDNASDQLDTFTAKHPPDAKLQSRAIEDNIVKNQKRLGRGTSFDIGFVYEKRDGKKTRYQYRLAASLIDIGSIKYNNTKYTYVTAYKGSSEVVFSKGMNGYNSRQYDTALANRFNAPAGKFQAFSMALPTSLNVSFDYRVVSKVYVNATWIQSMRSKYTQGIRAFSSLSVTPRFEAKSFSAAMPLVLNDDYRNFNVGLCVSILNSLYVGSDNLGGAFGIGNIAGTDVYAGLCINVSKHKKKTSEKAGGDKKKDDGKGKKDDGKKKEDKGKKEDKSKSDSKSKSPSQPKKTQKVGGSN